MDTLWFRIMDLIWEIRGKKAFPVHNLVQAMDNDIIDVPLAVHALTGILLSQNLKF